MKKIITILILFISAKGFSQTENNNFMQKNTFWDSVYFKAIQYNSSAGIVHLGIDTVAASPTFGKLVRKTAGGSTPTLQQVLTAGSTLTMNNTIVNDANTLEITNNTLAGTSGVKISSTSTAAASNTQKLFQVDLSGANGTGSQSTFGIHSVNAHTGTNANNIAVYGEVQNGLSSSAAIKGVAGGQRAIWGDVTSGTAIIGIATSGTGGSFSATNGNGIIVSTTSGTAATIASDSGLPILVSSVPTSTNTIVEIDRISRGTTGSAGIGIGASRTTYLATSGASQMASSQFAKWKNITESTRTVQLGSVAAINAIYDTVFTMGDYVALTESSATKFTSTTLATGKIQGGSILITVEANDATDFQSRTLRFIWSAVNKAGTLTITISTPEEVVALSSGTLTCTITAVDAGSGVLDFKANAVSSLTQSTLRATYQTFKNF